MVGVVFMLLVSIIIVIDLFWLHHHIASPILTRPRVHTDNELKEEGATALVPALKLLTGLQTLSLGCTLPPPNSLMAHKAPGRSVVGVCKRMGMNALAGMWYL